MILIRSYLYAPGNNDRLLAKVFDAGADAVVLDLEDSVPPSEKGAARRKVASCLRSLPGGNGPAVFVRVNSLETDLWRKDLRAVVTRTLAGIRLPKVETPDQIRAVGEELSGLEEGLGLPVGGIRLTCTIESATGLLASRSLAGMPRVSHLAFGAADFARDIAADVDTSETQLLYAWSHLVVASRAADIAPPIASVYTQLADLEGLRSSTAAARRLGFFGRSCIHPKQIPVIHDVFTPGPEEVRQASAVVAVYERALSGGSGAVSTSDGQFVDRAIVRRAEAVLALAESFVLQGKVEDR